MSNIGQYNKNALFSDAKVKQLREQFANGEIGVADIKQSTLISHHAIVKMLRGQTYKYAGGPINKAVSFKTP